MLRTWIWLHKRTSSSGVNLFVTAALGSLFAPLFIPPLLMCFPALRWYKAQPTLLRLLCLSESPDSSDAWPLEDFVGAAPVCFALFR